MILKGIKAVIFDLGGVVLDLDYDRCIRSFEEIGFEGAQRYVSCYHPMEIFGALERGEVSTEEFCDELRKMSGKTMSNEEIFWAYQAILIDIPVKKLRDMISLRERGYRVYALSNMSQVMLPRVEELFECDGLKMGDYFDEIFISSQMGLMKPDRRIYETVIERTGLEPQQMLFIDDGEKNITAARELGFMVYLAEAREDFGHLFE
ncbi:MAG: HAD family phosphatase [Rikenellaceae bacterium]